MIRDYDILIEEETHDHFDFGMWLEHNLHYFCGISLTIFNVSV